MLATMLATMLTLDRIQLDIETSTKEATLELMASLLAKPASLVDEKHIYETLATREALASTGIGSGVAIPHGRLAGLGVSRAAIAIHRGGIDFHAVDGLPVRIFVAILGDSDSHREHLTVLAQLSRNLREERVRARLLQSTSARQVFDAMVR